MLRRVLVMLGAVLLMVGLAPPVAAATLPAAPMLRVAPGNGAVVAV